MFSSRASIPTRRASQAALQINVPTRTPRSTIPLQQRRAQQQRRQYAMRAPSLQRRDRIRSKPRVDLLFKESEVPPLDFWQEYTSRGGPKDLTAEVCFNAASQYCAVAINGSSTWIGALERDHNIDPYTLHHIAIPLLVHVQETSKHLGMHMLTAASSLGYTPSTLSLIRILTQAGNVKLTERREMFRDTVARFKQLLQTGKNPNALTLQGLLLLREGNDTYALKYFDRAIEAARSKDSADQQISPAVRKPKWSYEGSCHQQRGLVLMKQGQREAAAAAFKIVALELNLAEGYLELAKLLPQNAPERETYLLKAAQAGKFEACECLALDAIDKAVEPGLSQADRKYAAKMAYEWALIEPESDKREKLTSLVAERFKGVGRLEGGFISTLWSRLLSRPAR